MNVIVISIGISLASVIALVVGAFVVFGKLKASARAQLERDVLRGRAARRLEEGPNFFGIESKGAAQLRGNGTLALVEDELVFLQWLPRRYVVVPLRDLIAVEEAKSHLGKTIARPLLRVRFRVEGGEDTIAWWVRDLPGWTEALQSALTRARFSGAAPS